MSVPKKMLAAVYDKPGSVSTAVEELDVPTPGPGDVLVRLTHSGVCHSDFGIMTSSWRVMPLPTEKGQIGGHEGIGEVVAMGPATEGSAVKVGDRVGIKWVAATCDTCVPCLAGRDACCSNIKISGYFHPGTFAQYAVGPARYVTPVPDGLDSAAAAPLLCAGVTVYSALKKSRTSSGDYVVLLGAGGGLGHLACQIASKGLGLRVIGVDHPSKKDLVLESGAEHFIDHTTSKDLGADVKALTGGFGAHACLVLTAANPAYAAATMTLRFGGTLVCVGLPEGDMVPIATAFPSMIVAMELNIVGSAVGNRKEAIETLELAARGIVKTHFTVDKLSNLTQIFEKMEKGQIQGRVVLDLQAK